MTIPEKSLKEMFPNRFLEAADLQGRLTTVTIAKIDAEVMEMEKGKKRTFIMNFAGKKKGLVLNKTNAYFIAQMFGMNPNQWVGKRLTIFPTKCRFGSSMVDCIRVYGSPDITQDAPFSAKIGRSTVKTTLKATKAGAIQDAPPPAEAEPERVLDITDAIRDSWANLGWTPDEGRKHAGEYRGDDYLSHLGGLIDQQDAGEVA